MFEFPTDIFNQVDADRCAVSDGCLIFYNATKGVDDPETAIAAGRWLSLVPHD